MRTTQEQLVHAWLPRVCAALHERLGQACALIVPRARCPPALAAPHPTPPQVDTRVLQLAEHDEAGGVTRWRLADVRANRAGTKGRGLSRKQRDQVFEVPLAALRRVNLHLDI